MSAIRSFAKLPPTPSARRVRWTPRSPALEYSKDGEFRCTPCVFCRVFRRHHRVLQCSNGEIAVCSTRVCGASQAGSSNCRSGHRRAQRNHVGAESGNSQRPLARCPGHRHCSRNVKGWIRHRRAHGNGVVVLRDEAGNWRPPSFISITGGSIGWQAGVQSTDVVLVFKTKNSIKRFASGKFTIGGDISAAAGPWDVKPRLRPISP